MFILRGFIYLLLLAGVAQCISLEAYELGDLAQYGEGSLTEKMQDFFALSSAITFAVCAWFSKGMRQACILLSALMLMMFIRESDSFLDQYVFDGAWQIAVFIVAAVTIFSLRNQVKLSYESLKKFSQTSSFGFVTAGLVIIIGFSRLFGRSSFWQSVMGDAYVRSVKNIVEEGTELLGYSIVMIAATELLFFILATLKEYQKQDISNQKLSSYAKANLVH